MSSMDYQAILSGAFDAAMLLDESGYIVYANVEAQSLFGFAESTPASVLEHHVAFWTFNVHQSITHDDVMKWDDICQMLHEKGSVPEWKITGTSMDHETFPGVARLVIVNDPNNVAISFLALYCRHSDAHETMTICSGSSAGSRRSQRSRRRFPRHGSSVMTVQDDTIGPEIIIDTQGNLLSFNTAATKQLKWCNQNNIGKPISGTRCHSITDHDYEPAILVNELGFVAKVNAAAIDKVPWCTTEIEGSHLSKVGKAIASNVSVKGNSSSKQSLAGTSTTPKPGVFQRPGFTRGKGPCKDVVESDCCSSESIHPSSAEIKVYVSTSVDVGYIMEEESEMDMDTFQSESAAIQRESIMSAIVEASLDPLFQIDESGKIQMVNVAATKDFGYNREEMLGMNIAMICGGGHGKNHARYLQRYLATGDTRVIGKKRELLARRKDGTEFPIELAVVEVDTFIGDERLFCGFIRNLTEVKAREQMSLGVLESSLDAMLQTDDEGKIEMVNEAAISILGWTREEFIGQNINMIVSSEHASKHDSYLKRYKDGGVAKLIGKRRELHAKKKNGSEFPVELYIVEISGIGGATSKYCGFLRDLTETKKQEKAAKEKERLVTGILNASLDPMFQINEKGIIQTLNPVACTMFGWERDDLLGKNIAVIVGGCHAVDHDQYLMRYLETGIQKVMGKKRELPAKRKDGSEFVVELSVCEIETDHGEDRLFCAYVTDLTERKKHESLIVERERLMTGIISASLDPMLQINEKGIIQNVNRATTSMFGWETSELLGSNVSKIVGGEHAAKHDLYLARYLKTGNAKVIGKKRELCARRKDGSEFPIELSIVEIETSANAQRLFCGYIRDLTIQKAFQKRRASFTNKIIEASRDALCVISPDGIITRVNTAAVYMFRKAIEAELIMHNFFEMLIPQHGQALQGELTAFLTVGIPFSPNREVEARRSDGSVFPASLAVTKIEDDDGSTLFACFITDLTDQKRMAQLQEEKAAAEVLLMTLTERRRVEQLQVEKAAAEVLLMNVLPPQIAAQLMADPQHIAESHDCAAIMFADIVGFTEMSSKMSPKAVVSMLNDVFSIFDDIVEQYTLNKIKTIGDCYMVTSVPQDTMTDKEACARVCHFALDMLSALDRYDNWAGEGNQLHLRVGLNVGEVVAGVVGTKRFLYDLWGDAVNTASRMESSGIPGKIQVTGAVVDLLEDSFFFEKRGTIEVKGKGLMETWFLIGRKKPSHVEIPDVPRSRCHSLIDRSNFMLDEDTKRSLLQSLHELESALTSTATSDSLLTYNIEENS